MPSYEIDYQKKIPRWCPACGFVGIINRFVRKCPNCGVKLPKRTVVYDEKTMDLLCKMHESC